MITVFQYTEVSDIDIQAPEEGCRGRAHGSLSSLDTRLINNSHRMTSMMLARPQPTHAASADCTSWLLGANLLNLIVIYSNTLTGVMQWKLFKSVKFVTLTSSLEVWGEGYTHS